MPELAPCNDKEIHAPWLMSNARQQALGIIIGQDYPMPVVDHPTRREQALTLYKKCAPAGD